MKERPKNQPHIDRIEYHEYEENWGDQELIIFPEITIKSPQELITLFTSENTYYFSLYDKTKEILVRKMLRISEEGIKTELRVLLNPQNGDRLHKRSTRLGVFLHILDTTIKTSSPESNVFAFFEEVTRLSADKQGTCDMEDGYKWIGYKPPET